MPSSLTRTVSFSAGHHYARPEWSDAQNEHAFGASRHRHGHNYRLEVTVTGSADRETGFVVDLGALDTLLAEAVAPLDQRDLTEAIDDFAPGGLIPSTELLAKWFWDQLAPRIPGAATLARIRLYESDSLWADYVG